MAVRAFVQHVFSHFASPYVFLEHCVLLRFHIIFLSFTSYYRARSQRASAQGALLRVVQYLQQTEQQQSAAQQPQQQLSTGADTGAAKSSVSSVHTPITPSTNSSGSPNAAVAAFGMLDTGIFDMLPLVLPQVTADEATLAAAVRGVASALLVEDDVAVIEAFLSFLFANAGLWTQGIVRACIFSAVFLNVTPVSVGIW